MKRISGMAGQRLYLLVSLVALLGLFSVAASARELLDQWTGPLDRWQWTALIVVAALIAIGNLLDVNVRIRSTKHGMAWADAAVLIGLAVLAPAWIVLVTAVSTGIVGAIKRSQIVKVVFAVAKDSTTAFVGGLVLVGMGAAMPTGQPGLIALAAAFLAMTIVDELLAIPVIAAASRTRIADRFRMNWDIRLVTMVGRFGVAAAAVLALRAYPAMLYAIPLPVIVAYVWHERWVRTREEREAWQNLARATGAFTGVDMNVVLHEAVVKGTTLFSADELEIEVWHGDRHRLVRGGEEITFDGDPAEAPADQASVFAMPLHGYQGKPDIGVLRLRFRDQITISERDEAMLSAYAAALDTAMRNASAYQRLGEATEAHAHAAAHDALTGLANRRELERYLTEDLASPNGPTCQIALVLIDLRHFKEVNDTLGHLAGDRVLARVAKRLTAAARPDDLVTRFGGDEFAILLRHAEHLPEVETRALRLLAALGDPLEVDGLPIVVEANGGLALAVDPQDDPDYTVEMERSLAAAARGVPADEIDDAEEEATAPPPRPVFREDPKVWMGELMRRADVAMYQAKRASRPLMRYTLATDPADRDRLALAGQLPRAVSEREFVLNFQPIVDLATGEVVGAEALARWRHPTRGQLDPRWFLDLVERSAQLSAFTAAVLDDALAAADMWRAAGHDLSVSVNISARSLLDTSLPDTVLEALDRHGTRPEKLCLELTETLALSQLDTVDQVLTRLDGMGVRLALDDFGTGFSSIGVVSRIPVHEIKIDRSFVRELRATGGAGPGGDATTAAQARAVVRSTVQLGRALDLTVVAEGVESEVQRVLLWELGCSLGQGHMFAKAVPAHELLAMLTRGIGGRPGALATSLPEDTTVLRLPRRRAR